MFQRRNILLLGGQSSTTATAAYGTSSSPDGTPPALCSMIRVRRGCYMVLRTILYCLIILIVLVFCLFLVLGLQPVILIPPSISSFVTSRTTNDSYDPNYYYSKYVASTIEQYVIDHAIELGFHANRIDNDTKLSCAIFHDPSITNPGYYSLLQQYRTDLLRYTQLIHQHRRKRNSKRRRNKKIYTYRMRTKENDIRHRLRTKDPTVDCNTLQLIKGVDIFDIFTSHQLSYTNGGSGWVEPLLPPLRHPEFCSSYEDPLSYLMSLDYLVHDFVTMCRSIQPQSQIILIDLGASFSFHSTISPTIQLIQLYEQFGFYFDHIYAYEATYDQPTNVYKILPQHLQASYHWINVPIQAEPINHPLNPFHMILHAFTPEDYIVIKLDIDTPTLEMALVHQLLQNDTIASYIDQFYFEHHVHQQEMAFSWENSMNGTIQESLQLFQMLRKKGIAAHYWV